MCVVVCSSSTSWLVHDIAFLIASENCCVGGGGPSSRFSHTYDKYEVADKFRWEHGTPCRNWDMAPDMKASFEQTPRHFVTVLCALYGTQWR